MGHPTRCVPGSGAGDWMWEGRGCLRPRLAGMENEEQGLTQEADLSVPGSDPS